MVEHILKHNEALIVGKVVSDLRFSHKVYGEGFYSFDLEVPRLSDSFDILPVTVSERLIPQFSKNLIGKTVDITGQFRSYNQYEEGRNRLVLTIFALEIKEATEESQKNKNSIFLDGYVCKDPVYRTTPFGREITDILLAVNRAYNKSDYIPCITWGRNARFAQGLKTGDHIQIWGRMQSRDYQKKLESGEVIAKVAYEVSIAKMEIKDDNNIDDTNEAVSADEE
jgi:primosomal replication protein N